MPADKTVIRADIEAMLRSVLGDFGTDLPIELDSTFRDDLGMESLDVVSLAGRLQSRFGDSVNFAQFVAGLDVSSMAELKVGDLVDFVARSIDAVPAAS
jgi:acyl carrier protein